MVVIVAFFFGFPSGQVKNVCSKMEHFHSILQMFWHTRGQPVDIRGLKTPFLITIRDHRTVFKSQPTIAQQGTVI